MRASGTGPCHQPGCRFMEEQLERRSEEEEQMKGGQEHAEHLPRDINKNLSCLQIWAQDICIYLLCAPLGAMPVGIGFKFLSLHVRKCNLTLKQTSKKKKAAPQPMADHAAEPVSEFYSLFELQA